MSSATPHQAHRFLPDNELLYWYGTPRWAIALLLCLYGILALVFGYLGFVVKSDGTAPFIRHLLQLLSLVFVYVALSNWNWEKWTGFYATSVGIVVPDGPLITRRSQWLAIPWNQVNAIEQRNLYGKQRGLCLRLQLGSAEVEHFLKRDAQTKRFLASDFEPENYPLCFSNAFIKPELAVSQLNELRTRYRQT